MGETMLANRPSVEARRLLALRRSISIQAFVAPGPTGDELQDILKTAMRVPDHRRLGPWRCITFEGEARTVFGQAAADIQAREHPESTDLMRETTRQSLLRAPTVVAVISSPKEDPKRTPVWEQELSVGALCQNLLLAANASGWAGAWITEWITYSPGINTLLGLTESERVAGYIYLGSARTLPQERLRPDTEDRISAWTP